MSSSLDPAVRVGVVISLLLYAPIASAQGQARPAAPPPVASNDLSRSLEAATRVVSPGVVEIFTTSFKPGEGLISSSADLVRTERGSGSGIIVDPAGYIVTNAHVVRGAQRLRVELPVATAGRSILAPRGRIVTGQIVGLDLETDLAVIKIDEKNLPALTFGDSDDLRPGQVVLAFGSPLGFHNSVSMGVVSAVARQLGPESPMVYVQTDASISPGSSGGPLVDLNGRVVGLNTLIMSRPGGSDGIGFAAPSNIVRTVYEQIKTMGRVRRGDIGVRAQTVTPVLAMGLGLPRESGVVIADVMPGSPAARAGLRPGDLVATVDGKAMENGRHLLVNVYRHAPGDLISLEIVRDGQPQTVSVSVAERRDPLDGLSASVDPRQNLLPRLSVLALDLDRRIAEMVPVVRVSSGVVVAATVAGALDAADGGLAVGDVIFAVNRTPVNGLAALRALVEKLKPGDSVVLHLERRGALMYLAFTVD
jgi:serine protease Do